MQKPYKNADIIEVEAAGGAVVARGGEADGRVLMMLRREMWDLPKGHLEAGETLSECAAREVCEECGLDPAMLEVGEELARTVHSYVSLAGHTEEKHTTWFRMLYTGNPVLVTPQTEEEISALEWVSPEEARHRAATSFETIQEVIEKLIQTI
jgi:8-oxo-dGTP pyrophosphatase MutT (NUDIX family)